MYEHDVDFGIGMRVDFGDLEPFNLVEVYSSALQKHVSDRTSTATRDNLEISRINSPYCIICVMGRAIHPCIFLK